MTARIGAIALTGAECTARYRERHPERIAAHREEANARRAAHYAAHREEARIYRAAYRAARREETRVRNAAYRAAHREEEVKQKAAYYAAHREEKLAWQVAWQDAHPEKRRELHRRSNAKRRGARPCDHAACLILGPAQLAWQLNPHACYLCGSPVWEGHNLHMDHVVPIARGGAHCAENLRPACAPCNSRKGARIVA